MSYWEKRQRQLNRALERDETALFKRLRSFYAAEQKKLDREIAAYYSEYAVKDVVEYRHLLQNLSSEDYALLMQRMDDFAKKYPDYAHLIPVRESIYKLNRLEGLDYSIQLQQLEIGAREKEEVEKHLQQLGERAFMFTKEDLGMGAIFNAVDAQTVHDICFTKWADGKNFSDRVWLNRAELGKRMQTEVAAAFARGDSYTKMGRMIHDLTDQGKKATHRLIYTEGTFVNNNARAELIKGSFDYFALSCLDGACEKCLAIQDETQAEPVRFSDRKDGVNFPPIHPWCRCSFNIVVPDSQAWINNYVSQHGGDPMIDEDTRRAAQKVLNRFR